MIKKEHETEANAQGLLLVEKGTKTPPAKPKKKSKKKGK